MTPSLYDQSWAVLVPVSTLLCLFPLIIPFPPGTGKRCPGAVQASPRSFWLMALWKAGCAPLTHAMLPSDVSRGSPAQSSLRLQGHPAAS